MIITCTLREFCRNEVSCIKWWDCNIDAVRGLRATSKCGAFWTSTEPCFSLIVTKHLANNLDFYYNKNVLHVVMRIQLQCNEDLVITIVVLWMYCLLECCNDVSHVTHDIIKFSWLGHSIDWAPHSGHISFFVANTNFWRSFESSGICAQCFERTMSAQQNFWTCMSTTIWRFRHHCAICEFGESSSLVCGCCH